MYLISYGKNKLDGKSNECEFTSSDWRNNIHNVCHKAITMEHVLRCDKELHLTTIERRKLKNSYISQPKRVRKCRIKELAKYREKRGT